MKKILPAALIVLLGVSGYFTYTFLFPSPQNQEALRRETPIENRPTGEGEQAPRPGEFGNGQPYAVYATDDFEVRYPNWPNIDRSQLPEPERTKVAVSNEGCTFMINAAPLPEGMTFKEYMEKRLQEQTSKVKAEVTVKTIGETNAHLEAEVNLGTVTVRSATYAFVTSNRQYYGIGFAAPKTPFDRVCQPLIQEVIESVRTQ